MGAGNGRAAREGSAMRLPCATVATAHAIGNEDIDRENAPKELVPFLQHYQCLECDYPYP